jgi:hypothetical protein
MDIERKGVARNKLIRRTAWLLIAAETSCEAKFYRLTGKGRKQLKDEIENRARLTGAIRLILDAGGDAE